MGDTASSSKGSRAEVSRGSDLTRETRGAAFAPVRMIAGLVVGGLITLLTFRDSLVEVLATGTRALRQLHRPPLDRHLRRSWTWSSDVVDSANQPLVSDRDRRAHRGSLGGWIGLQLKDVLIETCLHGTGPQERWCSPDYSFTGVTAASAAAGAATMLLLSGVAVNRRAIERRNVTDH